MNITETFVCPHCSGQNIALIAAVPLMSDVRVDTLSCNTCCTTWNLYSKIAETNIQIVSVPQEEAAQTTEEQHD